VGFFNKQEEVGSRKMMGGGDEVFPFSDGDRRREGGGQGGIRHCFAAICVPKRAKEKRSPLEAYLSKPKSLAEEQWARTISSPNPRDIDGYGLHGNVNKEGLCPIEETPRGLG